MDLETLYHSLRLNVAHTTLSKLRLWPNYGDVESIEHILLDCSAYRREMGLYNINMATLYQGCLIVKRMLSPWQSPSKRVKPSSFCSLI